LQQVFLDRIFLGNIEMKDIRARVRSQSRGDSNEYGNVGIPLLRSGRLSLDYINNCVAFELLK
jgi:hypothetical protein